MGKTLLLTGHPRIGKTTIIRKVVENLGQQAGGFYAEEVFGPGGRQGFKLVTLDGKQATLSHKDLHVSSALRVGRYGVDVDALDRVGVTALRRAMQTGKIVVVDEIGKMELLSLAFQQTLMRAILGPNVILGSIIYKAYPPADVFKTLAQVTVWEVTPVNRDTMAERVLAWLAKSPATLT